MNTPKVHLLKRPTKLPSGKRVQYWTLRWSDRNGKSRYRSLGRIGKVTRGEATAARRQMIVDLSNGRVRRDRPCRMTLSQFIDFHEQNFGHGKRPTTLIEWRTAGNHAVAALGDKLLTDVCWSDAGEIRAHLERNNKSVATIQKTISMLKAMLGRAAKRKMIQEHPFKDEAIGAPVKRPKRIFSETEIDAMIEVAPSLEWEAMIRLAATSGLRRAELLHLRWRDFDPPAGTVRVEVHDDERYVTENGQDVPILPWKPKTNSSIRTVPIPPQTVLILLRLQRQSDGSPYLFLSKGRLLAIDAKAQAGKLRPDFDLINNFTRQFDRIQESAKALLAERQRIEVKRVYWPHGCWHDLRKSFATRAASSGVPMHELKSYLGHSNISTTCEYYTDVEASAADRLRAVFAEIA